MFVFDWCIIGWWLRPNFWNIDDSTRINFSLFLLIQCLMRYLLVLVIVKCTLEISLKLPILILINLNAPSLWWKSLSFLDLYHIGILWLLHAAGMTGFYVNPLAKLLSWSLIAIWLAVFGLLHGWWLERSQF